MADSGGVPQPGASRFWLYAPFVILGLVAVAWSVAWFVVRDRARDSLDAWVAREASAGRRWTCADRSLGGYPFRIEVSCSSLTLQRGAVSASLGRMRSVAQVYQPRLVITEIGGPLQWSDGQVTARAEWRLLTTSVHHGPNGIQRASLAAETPTLRLSGLALGEIGLTGQSLEAHVRPTPSRPVAEGAYDVAISARQARVPALETWTGNAEPANMQLNLTAMQAQSFAGRPLIEELERWRQANGRIDLMLLSLAQGPRQIEAKGELRLDELHRPAGRFEVGVAGLDGLLGALTGGRAGAGDGLLGALLGGARPEVGGARPPAPTEDSVRLSRLPPLRLEGGRVVLGVFPLPGVRVHPLY